MFTRRRTSIALILALILALVVAPVCLGAKVSDIGDNTLRIGKDFYDLNTTSSYNFDNVVSSIGTGSELYLKFGGRWFDLMKVTSFDDLFNSSMAIPEQEIKNWTGLRYLYRDGSNRENIVADVLDRWTATDSFEGAATKDFKVNVSSLSTAKYFELYAKGSKISERIDVNSYYRSSSVVFSNPAELTVKFYISVDANSPIATATCATDGSLTVTLVHEEPPEDFYVVTIE